MVIDKMLTSLNYSETDSWPHDPDVEVVSLEVLEESIEEAS